MTKVKLFSSSSIKSLEKEINQWLEDNSWIKVLSLTQSTCSATMATTVTVLYQEPNVPVLG